MIDIRKEITNSCTLYLTKTVLYRTRTEQGLEAYKMMKRLVYVAYRMGGEIGYNTFLTSAIVWLDRKETIYNFMNIGYRLRAPFAPIYGLNVDIVVNGTYAQIEQQILNFIERHKNSIYYE